MIDWARDRGFVVNNQKCQSHREEGSSNGGDIREEDLTYLGRQS